MLNADQVDAEVALVAGFRPCAWLTSVGGTICQEPSLSFTAPYFLQIGTDRREGERTDNRIIIDNMKFAYDTITLGRDSCQL